MVGSLRAAGLAESAKLGVWQGKGSGTVVAGSFVSRDSTVEVIRGVDKNVAGEVRGYQYS
jgi:hypothetical protein